MSASTTKAPQASKPTAAPQAAPTAAPLKAGLGATSAMIAVEIASLQVNLPVKFTTGHVLTDNEAKTLDAAYVRQFTNNQNALAKARAEKFAAATTDADKAAAAPLTADQLAALYTDYAPQVGGGPRMGSLERLRHDAGWKAWTKVVAEHNKSIGGGGEPVIAKAGKAPVLVGPQRTAFPAGAEGTASYKAARKEWDDTGKDVFIGRLLTTPWMADRITAEYNTMVAERDAERAAREAEKSAPPSTGVAAISADSLF